MNLISIFSRFPDQDACIEHLESVRWGDEPHCPHCGGIRVARKADSGRKGRWNCRDCKSSFNVLSGTIMEKTKLPLQKWFLAIGLVINAKKSLSSHQLGRDLDMNQKSAWFMQQRIRAHMASEQGPLLQGIIEADETYIGGKPRKANRKEDRKPAKRGRGAENKIKVLGAVERGGKVAAQVMNRLRGPDIIRFLRKTVDPVGSLMITDEYTAYNAVRPMMAHAVINHSVQYADGDIHTNTIEGFWALVKRAWFGSHHKYTERFAPLFVAESAWKYNQRGNPHAFASFLRSIFP